jgi:hypothetical protein
VAEFARVPLAIIRVVNGSAALFAPDPLARRLGVDPEDHPAIRYVLRMFGIRTILIGRDLVASDDGVRGHAVSTAPTIHATDTFAAAAATATGKLPPRAGRMLALISATNTVLALVGRRGTR